jgi:hypothetical protein
LSKADIVFDLPKMLRKTTKVAPYAPKALKSEENCHNLCNLFVN